MTGKTTRYDPQLSTIKSCINAMKDKQAREGLYIQRQHLYVALEALESGRTYDKQFAWKWATALRVGLAAAKLNQSSKEEWELTRIAEAALKEITTGLKQN